MTLAGVDIDAEMLRRARMYDDWTDSSVTREVTLEVGVGGQANSSDWDLLRGIGRDSLKRPFTGARTAPKGDTRRLGIL